VKRRERKKQRAGAEQQARARWRSLGKGETAVGEEPMSARA
jgi:hypothetical protein